ncbi:DUF151 domain-containing protein [Actinomyces vulturis]|uniref:DUF151 domain-containing protein n=1 Tax=Actinomyces vulturis TaxID=1857645 RepID=UPI00159ED476|nr:DUF151 domain-containing protein [Actinomyces vulturis]
MAPEMDLVAVLVQQGGSLTLPVPVAPREAALLEALAHGAPPPGWVSLISSLTVALGGTVRHIEFDADDDGALQCSLILNDSHKRLPCGCGEGLLIALGQQLPIRSSAAALGIRGVDLNCDEQTADQAVERLRWALDSASADDFRPQ